MLDLRKFEKVLVFGKVLYSSLNRVDLMSTSTTQVRHCFAMNCPYSS